MCVYTSRGLPGLVKVFPSVSHPTGHAETLSQRSSGQIHKVLLLRMHKYTSIQTHIKRLDLAVCAPLVWHVWRSRVWGVPPWRSPRGTSWTAHFPSGNLPQPTWSTEPGQRDPAKKNGSQIEKIEAICYHFNRKYENEFLGAYKLQNNAYVYVCVYAYIDVHINILYIHIFIHTYIYAHIYMYIHVCVLLLSPWTWWSGRCWSSVGRRSGTSWCGNKARTWSPPRCSMMSGVCIAGGNGTRVHRSVRHRDTGDCHFSHFFFFQGNIFCGWNCCTFLIHMRAQHFDYINYVTVA